MDYQLLKFLHLFGVVIFLGNIIVTAVWKYMADRTRNPNVIAFSQRLVTITDIAFTAVGVVLIAVSGQLMAGGRDEIFRSLWLSWGYLLFIASGLIWLFVLIPIQFRQIRLTRSFQNGGEVPRAYRRLAQGWAVFGTIATFLPLVNVYLMVFKPS